MKKQTLTEHQLEALLSSNAVCAPDDFSDRLVARISRQAQGNASVDTSINSPPTPITPLWQWLALGTASLAGVIQVIGFVFGIWAATTAG